MNTSKPAEEALGFIARIEENKNDSLTMGIVHRKAETKMKRYGPHSHNFPYRICRPTWRYLRPVPTRYNSLYLPCAPALCTQLHKWPVVPGKSSSIRLDRYQVTTFKNGLSHTSACAISPMRLGQEGLPTAPPPPSVPPTMSHIYTIGPIPHMIYSSTNLMS